MVAVNLGRFARPRTASIFARDPATLGKIVSFILTDVAIPVPGRVRLDLTQSIAISNRVTAARSPIEPIVVDNIRLLPKEITITGSLSATPIGALAATRLGGFGSIIRRDLRELEKLLRIQAVGEPVVLVCSRGVFANMALSVDEQHTGANKVDLTLSLSEIQIVTPLSIAGVLDLDTILSGASSTTNAGAQPVTPTTVPAGVGVG